MKAIILAILATILCTPCYADVHLDYSAAFVPPHNEPVVGNKVARYRLTLEPELTWGRLTVNPDLTAWGVNTWTPSDSHASPSWIDDDWSVEEWRLSFKPQVSVRIIDRLSIFTEFYTPVGDWTRKGAGSFESYWWVVGVKGRLF